MSTRFRLSSILVALIALVAIGLPAQPSAAVGTYDFGSHPVGTTTTASLTVPLQGSLSDLPPDAVLYSGGSIDIDAFLTQSGVSTPVTVGSFISAFGDMTFSYEITGATLALGNQFSADASGCIGAVSSCSVSVSFTPSFVGVHTDTVTPQIDNIAVTGSSIGFFADLFAPFILSLLQPFLAVTLTGEGTPVPEGGVTLLVSSRAPAPCILLSDSTLDYGTLPFSSPGSPVEVGAVMAVSNCGPDGESVHARGTDATGDQVPPAVWSLVDAGANPCDVGVDKYGLSAEDPVGATFQLHVTTNTQFFLSLPATAEQTLAVFYQMPCDGSAGAGQLMTSQLTFLATVP